MPNPKKGGGAVETLSFKSPAEFFAEHQNIAGFDSAGRALYTTIREFVENSIDAAESSGRLPDVSIRIEEMDTPTFNRMRGLTAAGKGRGGGGGGGGAPPSPGDADSDSDASGAAGGGSAPKKDKQNYYRITCRDNGCGMPHDRIPDFLGRVLAGSKYGVRQTRGKFGLGAKMALIWAKKSTGMPIEVRTAHGAAAKGGGGGGGDAPADGAAPSRLLGVSTARIPVPARVSYCKLDIDIRKNEPTVLEHTSDENREHWLGTEISVVISGAWSAYRGKIMHYFQQLAVITPYASLRLDYASVSGGAGNGKGDFSYEWRRRSLQIPKPPAEVKHHPAAVNDLLVQQLASAALAARGGGGAAVSLQGFLTGQFQCVDKAAAGALIEGLGRGFAPGAPLGELTPLQFHQLTRALVTTDFPPPSARCLSPAGEYNLRLGIMKEVRPDMVATFTAPVGVFEGHPFIVEAGVSLGGAVPDGLTVYRFANRIPLLFEGGSDVATRTASTRIAWGSYKIDPNKDKVGVFVSLVSTKVPFKGTGKEYIGDDILEIRDAVRAAIMACAGQLRVKLLRAAAVRARADRRKNLLRYVPDVARALLFAFKSMKERRRKRRAEEGAAGEEEEEEEGGGGGSGAGGGGGGGGEAQEEGGGGTPHSKRRRLVARMRAEFTAGRITEARISEGLHTAVEKADLDAALEHAVAASAGLLSGAACGGEEEGAAGGRPLFLAPAGVAAFSGAPEVHTEAGVWQFLPRLLL